MTPSETDSMQHAVRSGSFEVVQFLLHNGATAEDMDARCYVYTFPCKVQTSSVY